MISTLKEQIRSNPTPDPSYRLGCRESVTGEVRVLVKKEHIRLRGLERTIRRLYVCDPLTQEPGVGWVIDIDVDGCMICAEYFGLTKWPHHCRCCGNLVCHPCSPEEVEVIELEKLGPVRVCVQCYYGQYPVHANFHLETLNADDEANEEDEEFLRKSSEVELTSTAPKRESLVPVPFFVIEASKKLSADETGAESKKKIIIYINVCVHEAMHALPETQEFVICDEVNSLTDRTGSTAEVYHALLRPDLLEADMDEIREQLEEVRL
ncbi:hypothetical protein EON64_14665 [archaeon]|nr:MAG: hypothetical protein EON64_14665 [archaeon]